MPYPHAPSDGGAALSTAVLVSLVTSVIVGLLGVISGSLVVLALAGDKLADAGMSAVNLWGYSAARDPADPEHPYGHGKLEAVIAIGQGFLLGGLALAIAVAALSSLASGSEPPAVGLASLALLGVVAVSGALAWNLQQAAETELSLTVSADAAHFRSDVISGGAALVAMALVWLTGWAALDPLASLVAVVFLLSEAWGVLRTGWADVLDEALPDAELAAVHEVLHAHRRDVDAIQSVRTRRSGPLRFVEVHIQLPPDTPLAEAHRRSHAISRDLRAVLPPARVLVVPEATGLPDAVDRVLDEGVGREKAG